MTQNALRNRLQRIERERHPPKVQPMVIYHRPEESEMDLARRVAAVGRPVAVSPMPCATAEEWEARYAPKFSR